MKRPAQLSIFSLFFWLVTFAIFPLNVAKAGDEDDPACRSYILREALPKAKIRDVSVAEEKAFREKARTQSGLKTHFHLVVPIFGELLNDNIWLLLWSYSQQTILPEYFELIFLVNNTPELARATSGTDRDFFLENQATLIILSAISQGSADCQMLDPFQCKVAQAVVQKGFKIQVLDGSTMGLERNMGKLRGLGSQAIRTNPNHIDVYAQSDGDTRVMSQFLENQMVNFELRGVETVFSNIRFELREGATTDSLINHHHLFGQMWEYDFIFLSLISPLYHYQVGGPQIMTTVSALNRVGGVPPLASREDGFLANRLALETVAMADPDSVVYSADRGRPQSYLGAWREEILNRGDFDVSSGQRFDFQIPEVVLIGTMLASWKDESSVKIRRLSEVFGFFGLEWNSARWNEVNSAKGEFSSKEDGIVAVRDYFTQLCITEPESPSCKRYKLGSSLGIIEMFRAHVAPAEFAELHRFVAGEMRQSDVQQTGLIEAVLKGTEQSLQHRRRFTSHRARLRMGHSWIFPYIDEIEGDRFDVSPEEVLRRLSARFPEHFDADGGRYRIRLDMVRAGTRFVQFALLYPEQFPTTSAFLNQIRELHR